MLHTIRTATNRDIPAIKEVVFSVLAEHGLEPDPDGIDADLNDVEKSYLHPGGLFQVIESPSGEIVGTAGLFPLDERGAELRKVCLKASARGLGLRTRLMDRMLATADALGYKEVRLESNSALQDAIRLYEKYGFTRTDAKPRSPRCDQVYRVRLPASLHEPAAVPPPAGVPRRFGVGTLLVVTTAFALLFGVLRALHVPGWGFVIVAGYIIVIALGQALLFGGKKPRLASYLVGAITWFGVHLLAVCLAIVLRGSWDHLEELFPTMFLALTFGGLLGYLTGCLIAGVFLLIDRWKGDDHGRPA